MYSYATRGLGFLVRCATISRQLGQGKQRSGGSPLFMINHRSSHNNIVKTVNTLLYILKELDKQSEPPVETFSPYSLSLSSPADLTVAVM